MPLDQGPHRPLTAALTAACLSLALPAAQAAKPAPNSPDRQAIVSAVRQHPKLGPALASSSLDIRRIWASDKYGFICLLPVSKKDHAHQRSGDAYVVQQIVLINKQQGLHAAARSASASTGGEPPATTTESPKKQWQAVARIDGLSESVKQVQCATDPQGQLSDEFLESIASNPAMAL